MRKIFKYPFSIKDSQVIKIKRWAKILCVQMQGDVPCIWAMVEEDAGEEEIELLIYGTGQAFDSKNKDYIGTVQTGNGMFVWHIFKDKK